MFNTIANAVKSVIVYISLLYEPAVIIRNIIFSILAVCTSYNIVYTVIGIFFTRKFKNTDNKHKYAIVIAARNEENVIGNLLDSINVQDYPHELITVFVVADNCTDKTSQIARSKGAICYERYDSINKTKGFALQYLFKNIEKDFGIENFEGYFVFDADNLLSTDYITRMNEAFDAGEKIVTSYRNTKNFDENWLASTYAIHWLRSIRFKHRARSVLRLATNIQGTGFLFANELIKDGWNYTSLTEDRAFTADAVAHGYMITYNDAAVFYDEQPTSVKIALRQRLRWSKGHLLALAQTGPILFKNIFVGKYYKNNVTDNRFNRFADNLRLRWASFDTLVQLIPICVVKLFLWISVSVLLFACFSFCNGIDEMSMFGNSIISSVLSFFLDDAVISVPPGIYAALLSVAITVLVNIISRLSYHIQMMYMAIYVFIAERKRIIPIPFRKKILYTITWPIFDAIGRWTTYIALFKKVEWKPIPHESKVTIDQIRGASSEKKYEKAK